MVENTKGAKEILDLIEKPYDKGFSDGINIATFYGWIFGMCTALALILGTSLFI